MPWKDVAHRGFGHVSQEVIKERCIYLHNIAPWQRCSFVKNSHCDDESELLMYHYLLFCGISNPTFTNIYVILYIIGMFVWIVLLFLILAITVDEYFCPSLGVLSTILHLSENLSGVTLLAMGNATPDILTSITSSAKGDTILMYNQILGSGLFVSCVVTACVVISRPFYLQPYHFLRDIIFTLGSIIWIQQTTADEKVTLMEACSYIGIYVVYLIIVIGGYLIHEKVNKYVEIDKKNDVDWTELRRRKVLDEDEYIDDMELFALNTPVEPTRPETWKTLFGDFCTTLLPFNRDDWVEMKKCQRFLAVIKAPFVLILNLLVPVISPELPRNGWSKLMNSFHCVVFPIFVIYATKLDNYEWFGVPIVVYFAPVGILMAIFVFCTSKQNTPPRYHNIFAFMCFTMGILIIFTAVKEIVAVLSLFGTLCRITPQMLGLTVLAWGNSLGDAVTNIQVARQGFQRMAYAGCFAGILANTLLSMGISFLMRNLNEGLTNEARKGVMGPNCTTFFIMNISFSIIFMLLTKFQARKSYGIFLILIYIEFLLFCALCEVEIIHPLGTDHEFSVDIFHEANESQHH